MTRLKAMLVGLGQIGCGYDIEHPFHLNQPYSSSVTLTHARALVCHPDVDLIAAVDPCADARDRFSKVYKSSTFENLDRAHHHFHSDEFDLVVVAVPPFLQASVVEELLRLFSPKILLIEKPVANNVEAALRLHSICDSHSDLVVAVNYIRRYLPPVLEIQRQMQSGFFGDFLFGNLVYGKGLFTNGSHFVNLAEAWLGPLCSGRVVSKGTNFAGFDYEACLTLTAAHHREAVLNVQSIGRAGLRAGELDLWFSKGRLLWTNNDRCIKFWHVGDSAKGDTYRSLMDEPKVVLPGIEHYQHHVVDNLVRHVHQPEAVTIKCDLKAGFQTLLALESAFHANC